jgi:diguanylate cyclase (GGDEF)-like protein/PAS domain S-box-containing protein
VVPDAALVTLLDRYPDAGVAALTLDGVYLPMPESVPLKGQLPVAATSSLDLVVPADRVVVFSAWDRVRKTGAARAPVHRHNGDSATLHYLDMRESHGVFILVLVDEDSDTDPLDDLLYDPPLPPRFCTVRRSGIGGITEIDEATTKLLGWTADKIVGHPSLEFIHPDDHTRAIDNWLDMVQVSGSIRRWRGRHSRSDGSWLWLEFTDQNLLDEPDHGDVVSIQVDISDEMAAHAASAAREEMLHRLAESLPQGVIQVDSRRQVIYTNARLAEIVGGEPVATLAEQLSATREQDRPALDAAIDAVLDEGLDQDLEVCMMAAGSEQPIVCGLTLRALRDEDQAETGAVICVSDVTASTLMRVELEVRATFDPLTGVHNRASIMSVLEATLRSAGRAESGTAVIFIDLDGFKRINDRMGHAAGDHLLAITAERLESAVRDDDVVGRIGGDEFLVVCPEIQSAAVAVKVAQRICDRLKKSVYLKGESVEQHASMGVAWMRNDGREPDVLVAQADLAMYESKRHGAGRPVLFGAQPGGTPTGNGSAHVAGVTE